jgi:hypothetical protein
VHTQLCILFNMSHIYIFIFAPSPWLDGAHHPLGCQLWLNCGWTATPLIPGFTLVSLLCKKLSPIYIHICIDYSELVGK